jgi:hypothetical protein
MPCLQSQESPTGYLPLQVFAEPQIHKVWCETGRNLHSMLELQMSELWWYCCRTPKILDATDLRA